MSYSAPAMSSRDLISFLISFRDCSLYRTVHEHTSGSIQSSQEEEVNLGKEKTREMLWFQFQRSMLRGEGIISAVLNQNYKKESFTQFNPTELVAKSWKLLESGNPILLYYAFREQCSRLISRSFCERKLMHFPHRTSWTSF